MVPPSIPKRSVLNQITLQIMSFGEIRILMLVNQRPSECIQELRLLLASEKYLFSASFPNKQQILNALVGYEYFVLQLISSIKFESYSAKFHKLINENSVSSQGSVIHQSHLKVLLVCLSSLISFVLWLPYHLKNRQGI